MFDKIPLFPIDDLPYSFPSYIYAHPFYLHLEVCMFMAHVLSQLFCRWLKDASLIPLDFLLSLLIPIDLLLTSLVPIVGSS